MTVTTTGFLDGVCNWLAGAGLGLTKGTNLFAENIFDNPDVIEDHFIVFDRGMSQLAFRHPHFAWDVAVSTSRKTRIAAGDAVRPIFDYAIGKRPTLVSDDGERYKVVTVRALEPGVLLSEKLDSGRYLSEATIQLQVIPD